MKNIQAVHENTDSGSRSHIGTFRDEFAEDVLHGLTLPRKSLPCKYIYDDTGTRLFSRITTLPEYYPSRCEAEIFETHGASLAETISRGPVNLVELGAGDGRKTRILVEALLGAGTAFTYVPIDISRAAVRECEQSLCGAFPGLSVNGMVSDYFDGLRWLSGNGNRQKQGKNVALFLGSTIGNFSPRARREFLGNLRNCLNPGDMVLLGFDLVKEIGTMIRAYNDADGVTAMFNKNILARINRELDGTFDLDQFRYYSTWNVAAGCIQSFLISRRKQKVHIGALSETISFDPWEAIHTESSYKFTLPLVQSLARESGFAVIGQYFDSRHYFTDSLWQAV